MILQTILKIAVLALLSPIWWPILKTLYREVEMALLEEGGLLGRPPTPEELAAKREKYGDYDNPLVSEPWAHAQARQKAEREAGRSGGAEASRPSRPVSAGSSAGNAPLRKRGF